MEKLDSLKVGTTPVDVDVVSEPYVIMTFRGYAPVVAVQSGGTKSVMYIAARSLGQAVEPLVKANDGKFTGLKLRLRKESEDKMAAYIVEKI